MDSERERLMRDGGRQVRGQHVVWTLVGDSLKTKTFWLQMARYVVASVPENIRAQLTSPILKISVS